MKMFFLYRILVLVTGLTVVISMNLAWADGNPGDYLHSRTYAGVLGTSVSVDNTGLFSGQNYSRIDSPDYEVSLIPSLSEAIGWGLLVGHREEVYALEVSYWQSVHNGTFGPGVIGAVNGASVTFNSTYPATAVYNSINVDFKRYFLTELQFQPFLDLGVCFPWITINDADIDSSGNFYTLTLAGLGLNLGVGAEYYISPNLSLTAGVYQRWTSFSQFSGARYPEDQYNPLSLYGSNVSEAGGGLNFAVGTTVGFE